MPPTSPSTSTTIQMPKGFKKLEAGNTPVPRLIISVTGREKHGKTHFALTAPGPIAYFDLDIGTEGVVEKFVGNGKQVYHKDYDYHILKDIRSKGPVDPTPYVEMWEQMKADFVEILGSKVRSVIFDTATEIWELLRMSRFGKLTQVMPHQYGPVNAEYRGLLRLAYMSNKNLILLHKMKAEYVNDKRTGAYERAGFSDTGFMVQVNVRAWRRLNDDQQLVFGLTVDDCRQNAEMAGMELESPMCDFPTLASMVTNTDQDEWK